MKGLAKSYLNGRCCICFHLLQDLTIWCEDGGLVKTSSVLLAAISPWLRSLLEDMGGKEVGLMD